MLPLISFLLTWLSLKHCFPLLCITLVINFVVKNSSQVKKICAKTALKAAAWVVSRLFLETLKALRQLI